MGSNPHHAQIYNTYEEFFRGTVLAYHDGLGGLLKYYDVSEIEPKYIRRAKRTWKRHIEKNGNVPLIRKCSVCSGEEHRQDIKHGRFKRSRPSKVERDETSVKKTTIEVI